MRFAILILLMLAPLPFGSARPVWQWFWTAYIALAFVALMPVYFIRMKDTLAWTAGEKRDLWLVLGTMALLGVWGLIQAWPGSAALLGDPYSVPSALVSEKLRALDTISVKPAATRAIALFLLSHALLFLAVYSMCRDGFQPERLMKALAVISGVYACYAFVNYAAGNAYVLWYPKQIDPTVITGPFMNRNNFATFMGLGLLATLVWCCLYFRACFASQRPGRVFLDLLMRRGWLLILSGLLILFVLVMTGSRGGLVACFLGVSVFMLSVFRGTGGLGSRNLILGLVAFFVVVLLISGNVVLTRLAAAGTDSERIVLFGVIIDTIKERPWTGFGMGTFEEVIRIYRTPDIQLYFSRGHSDLLETALTMGVPAVLLALVPPITLAARLFRGFGQPGKAAFVQAAGLAALAQVGAHALIDFPLQIPAISYCVTAMLAAALVAAHHPASTRQKGRV